MRRDSSLAVEVQDSHSRPHLKKSIFVSFTVATLVLTAALGYLSFSILKSQVIFLADTQSRAEARRIASGILNVLEEDPNSTFEEVASRPAGVWATVEDYLDQHPEVYRITVLNDRREVVREIPDVRAKPDELKGTPQFEIRPSPAGGINLVQEPIVWQGKRLGFIRMTLSRYHLNRQVAEGVNKNIGLVVGAGGVMLIFLSVLIYLTIREVNRGRRLEASAQQAHQLAYIGTLASGLAHEVRNPLNAMNINIQMAQEELSVDNQPAGEIQTMLGATGREIKRLEQLVSQFLDYARPGKLELIRTDVNNLVRQTFEYTEPEFEADGIEGSLNLADGEATVLADPTMLRQGLLNLLRNSCQAAGEGGQVRLSTVRQSGRVTVEIWNSGRSIPSEDLGRIFEAFYSTRRGGTGLGLPIVKRIVEMHGGIVHVESSPEDGTFFRILLPESKKA